MKTIIPLAVLWVGTLAAIAYVPQSPFVALGGDSVEPAKAKAGEVVKITRNFRITSDRPISVFRSMIKGDCSKDCEIIDLTTSKLTFLPGEYRNVVREHVVPAKAQPGVWRLAFILQWEDVLGRDRRQDLDPLEIEVVN